MGLVPKAVETVLVVGALWSAYWIVVQFVVRPDRGSVLARHGFAPGAEPPAGAAGHHG